MSQPRDSPTPVSLSDYKNLVGSRLGASRWFLLDQERIDKFAAVTEDTQFIHVDPLAAKQTPFGGTIAHGFLSLSLLGAMAMSIIPPIAEAEMAINYGLDGVRFLKPVGSGRRVRGSFVLRDFQDRGSGRWRASFDVAVEIEFDDKPALVADWHILSVVGSSPA